MFLFSGSVIQEFCLSTLYKMLFMFLIKVGCMVKNLCLSL